jgi:hypothetical protein
MLLREFTLAEDAFAEGGYWQLSATCWAASIVAEMAAGSAQDDAEDRLSRMIGLANLTPDQLAWVRRLRADGQQSPQWCVSKLGRDCRA